MIQDKSSPAVPPVSSETEADCQRTPELTRIAGQGLRNGDEGERPLFGTEAVSSQIEQYREQVGLTSRDGEMLRCLHQQLGKYLGEAYQELIDRAVSETALTHHAVGDTDLDQLGYSLRGFFDWFQTFDPQSTESLKERVDFYLRHRVLGLSSTWYLTAYEEYLSAAAKLILSAEQEIAPSHALLESLHRLALFDLGLVNHVYLFTRGRRDGDGDYAFPARRRKDFIDRLDALLAEGSPTIGVFVLGVDNLHQINSVMGHQIGDLVMQHVASRLMEELREADILQRTGASEFAIFIPHIQGRQVALLAASKFISALNEPLHIGGRELHLSPALGIAVVPEHGDGGSAVLQHAELAMREAASSQLDFVVFNRGLQERSRELYSLETELRRAINDGDELCLRFQPQVDFKTNRIVGCEALLRWQNAKYGNVPPAKFVPIAEKSGLIHRLTVWVLQNAVREYSMRWADRGQFTISANISAMDLLDPDFPEMVERTLQTRDVNPQNLLLEITESVMMEKPRAALKSLERLHGIGVKLSIDDFGTGHSSLMYLKRLSVNELKIDRSFVLNMIKDAGDEQIVRTIIDLAHNFGLAVIAEGVENLATSNHLKSMGCDLIQGYLIGRPMPADELTVFLEQYSNLAE